MSDCTPTIIFFRGPTHSIYLRHGMYSATYGDSRDSSPVPDTMAPPVPNPRASPSTVPATSSPVSIAVRPGSIPIAGPSITTSTPVGAVAAAPAIGAIAAVQGSSSQGASATGASAKATRRSARAMAAGRKFKDFYPLSINHLHLSATEIVTAADDPNIWNYRDKTVMLSVDILLTLLLFIHHIILSVFLIPFIVPIMPSVNFSLAS